LEPGFLIYLKLWDSSGQPGPFSFASKKALVIKNVPVVKKVPVVIPANAGIQRRSFAFPLTS
jgi:hypothetical protein